MWYCLINLDSYFPYILRAAVLLFWGVLFPNAATEWALNYWLVLACKYFSSSLQCVTCLMWSSYVEFLRVLSILVSAAFLGHLLIINVNSDVVVCDSWSGQYLQKCKNWSVVCTVKPVICAYLCVYLNACNLSWVYCTRMFLLWKKNIPVSLLTVAPPKYFLITFCYSW